MTNKILDDINEAINNHTEDHTTTEMWIHEDAWEEMLKNKEEILDKSKPTLEDKQKHFEKTKMETFKHSSRLEGVGNDED